MPTKAEQLDLARVHVREAELRVQNQSALIEMLRHDQFDSTLAEAMLAEYRTVLMQMRERVVRLEREQDHEAQEGGV